LRSGEPGPFESVVLPHLSEAYTLARYLTRNDHDAEDVVQDAFLRAYTYRDTFRGGGPESARAWLLAIVRNTAYSWRRKLGNRVEVTAFDEAAHSEGVADQHPEAVLLRNAGRDAIGKALDDLPPEFREAIILREIEGLSYQEISEVVGVPTGTVMSRLSRARDRLRRALQPEHGGGDR
jgi:RNA polymerase sigma factor (sigma-70 family)